MSIIRIARQNKPKTQLKTRPFTEREKELNKMSRRDMLKEWRMKLDPYRMKAIKTFDDGTANPCYYMSLYRIQNFIKTNEKSENPLFKRENEDIRTAIEFITVFKDVLHCTTSEAVAIWMLYKPKIEAWMEKHKKAPPDKEMAAMAREAISEFRENWSQAMEGLEVLWRK